MTSTSAISLYVRLQGGSDFLTGLVGAVPAFVYIFSAFFLGRVAHEINRKTAVVLVSAVSLADVLVFLGLWYATGLVALGVIFAVFALVRALDGFALGLYWPVLQSRIADEKYLPGTPVPQDRLLRRYNLAWNLGVVLGYVMLILATVPPDTPGVLWGLFLVLLVTAGFLAYNLWLSLARFREVRESVLARKRTRSRVSPVTSPAPAGDSSPPPAGDSSPAPTLAPVPSPAPSPAPFPAPLVTKTPAAKPIFQNASLRRTAGAFAVICTFAFITGQLNTTITNHLTRAQATAGGLAVNLVLFVPVLNLVRASLQAAGSSLVKLPVDPERWFSRILAATLVLQLGFALTAWAFPAVGVPGVILFLLLVAPQGALLGLMYSASIAKTLAEGGDRPELLQGVFEAVIGVGFFVGAMASGAITETWPYAVPYWVNVTWVGVVLAGVALLRRARKQPASPTRSSTRS